jgi:hypothetical protein
MMTASEAFPKSRREIVPNAVSSGPLPHKEASSVEAGRCRWNAYPLRFFPHSSVRIVDMKA